MHQRKIPLLVMLLALLTISAGPYSIETAQSKASETQPSFLPPIENSHGPVTKDIQGKRLSDFIPSELIVKIIHLSMFLHPGEAPPEQQMLEAVFRENPKLDPWGLSATERISDHYIMLLKNNDTLVIQIVTAGFTVPVRHSALLIRGSHMAFRVPISDHAKTKAVGYAWE